MATLISAVALRCFMLDRGHYVIVFAIVMKCKILLSCFADIFEVGGNSNAQV